MTNESETVRFLSTQSVSRIKAALWSLGTARAVRLADEISDANEVSMTLRWVGREPASHNEQPPFNPDKPRAHKPGQ
jgi:hypothetical protein